MIATFISMNFPKHIVGKIYGISFGISIFGRYNRCIYRINLFCYYSGHYDLSIITVSVVAFIGFIIAIGLNRPKVFRETK